MRPIALAAALAIASPLQADRLPVPTQDEAMQDAGLMAAREALRDAVARRDTGAVVSMACPDIFLSFGGNGGRAEFRMNLTVPPEMLSEEYRHMADEMRDDYWRELADTLSYPGYFDTDGSFWMPRFWGMELPEEVDPFLAYFSRAGAKLRKKPSKLSKTLAVLDHELIVAEDFDDYEEPWRKVRLGDGTPGYVRAEDLRALIGYRANMVQNEAGTWQLCLFVAGD